MGLPERTHWKIEEIITDEISLFDIIDYSTQGFISPYVKVKFELSKIHLNYDEKFSNKFRSYYKGYYKLYPYELEYFFDNPNIVMNKSYINFDNLEILYSNMPKDSNKPSGLKYLRKEITIESKDLLINSKDKKSLLIGNKTKNTQPKDKILQDYSSVFANYFQDLDKVPKELKIALLVYKEYWEYWETVKDTTNRPTNDYLIEEMVEKFDIPKTTAEMICKITKPEGEKSGGAPDSKKKQYKIPTPPTAKK